MKVTHQVASIDNEGVSQGKSQAAYNVNMRNWVVKTSQVRFPLAASKKEMPSKHKNLTYEYE